MSTDVNTIQDPLGRTIYLLQYAEVDVQEISHELYDDAATVIRKPAMLFEVIKELDKQLFYFRSTGWQRTMLVIVHFQNQRWETLRYVNNPSNEMLSEMMKNGSQLI